MDQPSAKKRRKLAPKGAEPPPAHPPPAPYQHESQPQHYVPEPPPAAERHDFESFARHLQDAAMLIQRQTERPPYANVSVLLLRWDEDTTVESDLVALEQVLSERYNYRTERWSIPTVANPSIKLGVQMASFLENARANHLLIIYYVGYGYVGSDNQLYWAANARDDASKLKWDGVRCLFEDAQSDILLLLDTCSIRDAPMAGSHGIKQGIAACGPENNPKDPGGRTFTSNLIEGLQKLSTGRPFTVQRLFEEIYSQKQQELSQATRMTNGAGNGTHPAPQLPIFFTLTAGKGQSLSLSPLPSSRASREDPLIDSESVVDLRFDEQRVLVCTTFVGEASPDMSSYNHWLHNTPPLGAKISVEGMFLGPPTMLLISMPHSVWNIVQHDKVCCFLGYISSHNMIHLYQRVLGSTNIKATAKEVEDGRILLEAREVAAMTPNLRRRETDAKDGLFQQSGTREAGTASNQPLQHTSSLPYPPSTSTATAVMDSKDEVEDSAEMQEAAEQLKALSHVRHLSNETPSRLERRRTGLPDGAPETKREDTGSSPDPVESGPEETIHAANTLTPTGLTPTGLTPTGRKPRKTLGRQIPKQETRCNLCSHAPFKDSSTLRKHIAAAHTRPFPCAFSFAGCTSTFGSKNEWKRHIASQHLCLQYYRCSACPQSAAEGKGNEFNRKDLFTQHLRRMHAPFAIKKAIAKGDGKLQLEWEAHVKDMQQSCLVQRRHPPQRSACPKPECQSVFEGPGSWDEWTEHVGRHMEKGEAQRLGVDRLLAKYALDEGIIERKPDGEYRLCAVSSGLLYPELKDSISVAVPDNLKHDQDGSPNGEQADDKMEVD